MPHASYNPPMNPLSTARRSELRAQAHTLTPVVIIGDKGLTDEIIAEVDRSLKAHELIKVRAAGGERENRGSWMQAICERLEAHPVQQIGKVLVIYRANPKEARVTRPEVKKPLARGTRREDQEGTAAAKKKPRASAVAPRTSTRNGRPLSRTPSPRPESEPRRRRPRTSR
jgi:RNA-binding protein